MPHSPSRYAVASGRTITVNYAAANGSATAPADYVATSGTLTFAAGATSQVVNVPVIGDTMDETDETLVLNLTAPTNATIARSQGTATITDDDAPPSASIGNASRAEGKAGSANLSFTVTLSAASGRPVTVDYATSNGTASAGSDYTLTTGTLSFPAGTTTSSSTSRSLAIRPASRMRRSWSRSAIRSMPQSAPLRLPVQSKTMMECRHSRLRMWP